MTSVSQHINASQCKQKMTLHARGNATLSSLVTPWQQAIVDLNISRSFVVGYSYCRYHFQSIHRQNSILFTSSLFSRRSLRNVKGVSHPLHLPHYVPHYVPGFPIVFCMCVQHVVTLLKLIVHLSLTLTQLYFQAYTERQRSEMVETENFALITFYYISLPQKMTSGTSLYPD